MLINNILITSAGRRVRLVQNFQETLKKYNKNAKVFTTDLNPSLSSAAQVSDAWFEVSRVTSKTYIQELLDICKNHTISIIVPTIDTELSILAREKDYFRKEGIFIAISSESICDTFHLKSSTEIFFTKHHFDTPRSIANILTCKYPIFAKHDNSSCSIGAQIVHTSREATDLAKDENYIFQEYIAGDEYTIDFFIDSNFNVIVIVPRQRLEVRAGEVSKAQCIKDSLIIDAVKKLAKKLIGAYGCITVQLFKEKDRITFIEINPRFGGGYPLSWQSGANFADLLIKDYLGEKLHYFDTWKDKTLMLRYDAEVIL